MESGEKLWIKGYTSTTSVKKLTFTFLQKNENYNNPIDEQQKDDNEMYPSTFTVCIAFVILFFFLVGKGR